MKIVNKFFSIKLTKNCANKIKNLKNNSKLRLMVDGGGCSGYQYIFKIEENIDTKEDIIIEEEGAQLVIDKLSIDFVKDSTIDYKETLIKSGFYVVENENAEMNCSCGSSFSLKNKF
jgi:iron-sulfur cluster assembly accessory protein